MRTDFSPQQLKNPSLALAQSAIRACVHCGLCTATCPTFLLLGDELDSPRGRIYLIKDMLEKERAASEVEVRHLDRCLHCLACTSVCPVDVDYHHLLDRGYEHIAETYRRPLRQRLIRGLLGRVLTRPRLFYWLLTGARTVTPVARWLPRMMRHWPGKIPKRIYRIDRYNQPGEFPAQGHHHKRIALLAGCAQQILDPAINAATIRLLNRHGCDVVIAESSACCGALEHHLQQTSSARQKAIANIRAWKHQIEHQGLDAIVVNTSGCGSHVRDYAHLLRDDPEWSEPARKVSELCCDISELMLQLGLGERIDIGQSTLRVAYHAACSLQHAQQIIEAPITLLREAGFDVLEVPQGHLCCGSAGSYSLLQANIADRLGDQKAQHIASLKPELIAAGNIGCMQHLQPRLDTPILHTVQLLDWATGGPDPRSDR